MTTGDNTEKDFLADLLKSRLENAEMPVDENCWAEIEKRMQKKNRIIPFWLWSAIGGAAAVAILFIGLLPFTQNMNDVKMADKLENKIENLTTSKDLKGITTVSSDEQELTNSLKNGDSGIPGKQQNSGTKSFSIATSENNKLNNTTTFSETTQDNVATASDNNIGNTGKTNNPDSEKVQNAEVKPENNTGNINSESSTKVQEKENLNPVQKEYVRPKRKTSRPLLAAVFGSGSSINSSSAPNMEAAPVYENLAKLTNTFARIMAPNEFSDINDLPPLSFGLKISKELCSGLSIESGLMYTYMATTYRESNYGDIEADMNLHYLGIPLNLKYDISQQSNWEIYVMGGGMIEKGLRSVYNQYTYSGNYTYKTVAKTRIDGFQFSVNGATGFSYHLFRDISIYFEPTVTWYFDNNQPRSARTQQALVVGLNGGLKFKI